MFSGLPVRIFNSVVQTLVRSVMGIGSDGLDRLNKAAQFVRHDRPRLTKLPYQCGDEASGRPAVAASLNQDIENISTGINGVPEPELPAVHRNDGLIHVPVVVGFWPVPLVPKTLFRHLPSGRQRLNSNPRETISSPIYLRWRYK